MIERQPQPAVDPSTAKALTRRPVGWTPPGPAPAGARGRSDLLAAADEDHSYLTGDWRIFQLRVGHRWSLDDFATALVALDEARRDGRVARFLDLGCGIGSVLMMVAWGLPEARGVGIEAQERSATMARRSLAWNGADDRVRVVGGDLREVAPALVRAERERFDLVTGTPPYIPVGHGTSSDKMQRGPCCFETRGGLEEYCRAAAEALAPQGVFVTCAGAQGPTTRGDDAARAAGLRIVRRVQVVPREGKPALFWVYAMKAVAHAHEDGYEQFVVRDREGEITDQMHEARRVMGFPPVTPRSVLASSGPRVRETG